ncbi:MAG: hypothetical protein KDD40_07325 [Bdellovibrionales bacterium]|nr:hypothetical protein [Bdellovibrionales bacterium]
MSNTMNFNHDPLQNLAQHVANLQKRLSEMDNRLEQTNERLMSLAKASKERFDRMQTLVATLDFAHKKSLEDLRIELSRVAGTVTQKRVIDTRLEQAIAKHSDLVGQIEMRIQEIKKLVSAQDMRLVDVESQLRAKNVLKY